MREEFNYHSPLGLMEIHIRDFAVTKISFTSDVLAVAEPLSDFAKTVVAEMNDYFAGKIQSFTFPIKTEGTAFQQRVWSELQKIPYGETISYQELAKRSGNARAYRAAGNANGKNPVCIAIPCHRVVKADSSIGGYAYGTDIKQQLLNLEKKGNI